MINIDVFLTCDRCGISLPVRTSVDFRTTPTGLVPHFPLGWTWTSTDRGELLCHASCSGEPPPFWSTTVGR